MPHFAKRRSSTLPVTPSGRFRITTFWHKVCNLGGQVEFRLGGCLVDPGNQAPGMGAIDMVLTAEVCAQKPLLGGDAGNEDRNCERCEQHSHTGSESERPSEHVHQQAQIAWVANSA